MPKTGKSSYFIIGVIVLYAFLFEFVIFEVEVLRGPVNIIKLVVPLLMMLLIPVGRIQSRSFRLFSLFFLLFMLWGLIPGLFASEYLEAISTWLKYAPRALFTFLVGIYFLRTPAASLQIMKIFALAGVLTVGQFLLLIVAWILNLAEQVFIAGSIHYGPFGLLGNQSAVMYFSEIPFPIFRLTGFWHEPSNASGFLFAGFFLARALYGIEKKLFWRIAGYICLAGGFLALSNAGYLAIAAPTFFAALFMKKSGGKFIYVVVLAALSLGLAFFALQGRTLVAEQYSGSGELKALAGARAGTEIDPYSGRIELLTQNIETLVRQPFGIGMRISGEGHYEAVSASAPIQWLTYTGFIGLILLLLREYHVLILAIRYSKESPIIMGVSQAWLAVFTQHLAYGTWMTPVYLILCLLVISTFYHYRRNAFGDHFSGGAGAPLNEVKVVAPVRRRVFDRAASSGVF